MPARTTLMKQSLVRVMTGDAAGATVVRLTLGHSVFQLEFRPNLVIDLPAPLSDIGLGGIEVALQTGEITPRLWYERGAGLPVGHDAAEDRVRQFMRDLITSTPLALPPYEPSSDRDLILTVRQILQNLNNGGASCVSDIVLSAELAALEELAGEAGGGGFRVPKGATIKAEVALEGGPKEIEASPKVLRAQVDCSSFVLRKGGADQAELGRVVLKRGGSIEVDQVRAMGDVGKVAAGESLIRLFGQIAGGGGIDPRRLQARMVEGLLKKEIESALKPALTDWVRSNATATAGLDLGTALGIAVA